VTLIKGNFIRGTTLQASIRTGSGAKAINLALKIISSLPEAPRILFILSDADGRKTIMQMLGGIYIDKHIGAICADPPDEANWAVHVFLGVNRDLSNSLLGRGQERKS
jgi:hypothetical protein